MEKYDIIYIKRQCEKFYEKLTLNEYLLKSRLKCSLKIELMIKKDFNMSFIAW